MFICIQKVIFISNLFFEILRRHCKLALLGTLGILDHFHQNHSINLKEAFMLICMQKITHLETNSKLVILGNMGCLPHTHKMTLSLWRNLQRLSVSKKSASSFTFSFTLTYCKDIVNLLFWVLWAFLVTHTQNDTVILQKTFIFICRQKVNFIPHTFMEILQRYANLFWLLSACLVTHTQNDSISL